MVLVLRMKFEEKRKKMRERSKSRGLGYFLFYFLCGEFNAYFLLFLSLYSSAVKYLSIARTVGQSILSLGKLS